MDILRAGTRSSAKGPEAWFTGTVRIDPLFNPFDAERVQGAQVTFEPGARTAWHTHPLGQTLIVVSGLGRGNGGAVERHEGATTAPAEIVEGAGHHLFARSRLAVDEHVDIEVAERSEATAECDDPGRRTDEAAFELRLQQTQTRTVVFVTHDLDEAIRLADRIAIMEAGRIIQIGTPEELVTEPATDYVRRFVAKVPPARVVRVASIMTAEAGPATAAWMSTRPSPTSPRNSSPPQTVCPSSTE